MEDQPVGDVSNTETRDVSNTRTCDVSNTGTCDTNFSNTGTCDFSNTGICHTKWSACNRGTIKTETMEAEPYCESMKVRSSIWNLNQECAFVDKIIIIMCCCEGTKVQSIIWKWNEEYAFVNKIIMMMIICSVSPKYILEHVAHHKAENQNTVKTVWPSGKALGW